MVREFPPVDSIALDSQAADVFVQSPGVVILPSQRIPSLSPLSHSTYNHQEKGSHEEPRHDGDPGIPRKNLAPMGYGILNVDASCPVMNPDDLAEADNLNDDDNGCPETQDPMDTTPIGFGCLNQDFTCPILSTQDVEDAVDELLGCPRKVYKDKVVEEGPNDYPDSNGAQEKEGSEDHAMAILVDKSKSQAESQEPTLDTPCERESIRPPSIDLFSQEVEEIPLVRKRRITRSGQGSSVPISIPSIQKPPRKSKQSVDGTSMTQESSGGKRGARISLPSGPPVPPPSFPPLTRIHSTKGAQLHTRASTLTEDPTTQPAVVSSSPTSQPAPIPVRPTRSQALGESSRHPSTPSARTGGEKRKQRRAGSSVPSSTGHESTQAPGSVTSSGPSATQNSMPEPNPSQPLRKSGRGRTAGPTSPPADIRTQAIPVESPEEDSDDGNQENLNPNPEVDAIVARKKEYERLRKKAYRERVCLEAQVVVTGSESVRVKPTLELHQGIPVGDCHRELIRELAAITKREVLCFTPVHDIPDHAFQKIYNKLHLKYENGNSLCYRWTRRNTGSLVGYRRTRTRKHVAKIMEIEADLGEDCLYPPEGIFPAEVEFFKAELKNEDFLALSRKMAAKSAAMIQKRGCGNPMGRGGVARAAAFHVSHNNPTPRSFTANYFIVIPGVTMNITLR